MCEKKEYKRVSCIGLVKSMGKYCYTEDDIPFYTFEVYTKVFDRTIKVIASEIVINEALQQALVDKIYPEVSIWLSGIYEKDNIYTDKIIFIDDILAANECGKISDGDRAVMLGPTAKQSIVFKARISSMQDSRGILVSPFESEYLPSILRIGISNTLLMELLKKVNISRLHVSNVLLVEGNLDTLMKSGYEGKIDALCISLVNEKTENNNNSLAKEVAQRKHLFEEIKKLPTEQTEYILGQVLWEMRSKSKVGIIYENLSKKERREMFKKLIFGR